MKVLPTTRVSMGASSQTLLKLKILIKWWLVHCLQILKIFKHIIWIEGTLWNMKRLLQWFSMKCSKRKNKNSSTQISNFIHCTNISIWILKLSQLFCWAYYQHGKKKLLSQFHKFYKISITVFVMWLRNCDTKNQLQN